MHYYYSTFQQKKAVLYTFLYFVSLSFWAGCSPPRVESTEVVVGVPPSLQASNDSNMLVTLDAGEVDALHIETHTVTRQVLSHIVRTQGEVMASPEHFSYVSAPIHGRVKSITAHEGERVRRGAILLELESLEFADLVATHYQAKAHLALATIERDRAQELVGEKITAQRTLDQKEAVYHQAQAALAGSFARLQAMGLSTETIEGWMDLDEGSRAVLPLRAPLTGYIDQHLIDLGQSVSAYDELLTIVDPGYILIKGYVPPDQASDLKIGDTVQIYDRDEAGRSLSASISTINPALDAENRSTVVNILTESNEGWPRPGTSVSLHIEYTSSVPQMVVPLSAIQYEGAEPAVFVKREADVYEKRLVDLGQIDQELAVIRAGLEEGEEIAITQVFNLKALSRFDQFGEE